MCVSVCECMWVWMYKSVCECMWVWWECLFVSLTVCKCVWMYVSGVNVCEFGLSWCVNRLNVSCYSCLNVCEFECVFAWQCVSTLSSKWVRVSVGTKDRIRIM